MADLSFSQASIPVLLTDETNFASVKPASTAAAAADTSLVVGLSPNSSLPAGTNSIGAVTQATAANLNATVRLEDGSGNAINSVSLGGLQRLSVSAQADITHATSLGQVFSAGAHSVNAATGSSDNAILYIKNPTGSGKTLYVHKIFAGVITANRAAVFGVFVNPTSSANGTSATVNNNLAGSATATVTTAFTLPTVSATGNLLRGLAVGQNSTAVVDPVEGSIQVPPNNTLLVTANPSANATLVEISAVWQEV